jgi:hypothetical protein
MIEPAEGVVDDCVRLAPRETVAGRAFTDPVQATRDLAALRVMLAEVRRRVARAATLPASPRPLVLEGREADGRAHRAVLCDEGRLGDGRDLTWVGFFGVKRRDVDPAPLTVRDEELVREFPAHPGVLSYSSLELPDGDWGNLILLDGDDARERWRVSERHADATRVLAPRHYTDVRLHQGVLPGGVRAGRALALSRTRYYDYRDGVTWRAERAWPPPPGRAGRPRG